LVLWLELLRRDAVWDWLLTDEGISRLALLLSLPLLCAIVEIPLAWLSVVDRKRSSAVSNAQLVFSVMGVIVPAYFVYMGADEPGPFITTVSFALVGIMALRRIVRKDRAE